MIGTKRLKRTQLFLLFLAPTAITVGWLLGALAGAPIPLLGIGFIIAVISWYGYMKIPYQFDYEAGKFICFRSFVRTKDVSFQEIKSVDVRRWNRGFVIIRYVGGSIFLFRNMPGIKTLVKETQRCNPSVLVRGSI